MKNKKVIFAIVLFLLIGLTVFTFANTDEQNFEDSSKEVKENSGSKTNSEETTKDNESTTNEDTTTLTTENSNNNTNQTTRQNTATVNANNTQNDAAKSAVEKAESTLTQTDVDNAQTLVGDLTDTNVKEDLENRLEEVQNTIDVTLLVDNLEKQVNDATMLSNIVDARDYRSSSKVVEKVNALNNTTKKEELTNRLNTLSNILDDEDVPSVTGIDAEFTNQNVTLTITDANTFTAMLNGKSYVSGSVIEDEGEYTLTVIDEAFNESKPLTFTIDKTDPVFDGLKSGGHYDEITINVVDENIKTITVKNMDKNVTEEVQNGTKLTDDATYYITAIDKAGNDKSIFVAIDKKDPTIGRKIGGNFVNQNEIVTINDKFLMTVDIDGTVYTRDNFTVGANNENFTLEKEISEEGTHTITATDKMGNTVIETFTVDKGIPELVGLIDGFITNKTISLKANDANFDYINVKNLTTGKEFKEKREWTGLLDDGVYELQIFDKAGNSSEKITVTKDSALPVVLFNANGASAGSNYAYKNVTATVTIKDATLKEVYYVWDKRDNKLDENTFKNATKLDVTELTDNGDGTYSFNTTIDSDTAGYRLKVKAIDKAGNISQEKTNRFVIDNTIPTAEIEYSTKDSTKDNVTVKLVNTSEEITIINNDGKDTYTFTDNGEFTFEFKDKAGNIGTAKAIVANIDRILPVITVNSNGASAGTNYAYKQIKLTINITEENLKEIYYVWSTNNNLDENTFNNATKVDVTELTKNEDGTYSLTVEKSNENTGYRLKVKAVDMALNEQTLKTNRYILDNTAPIFNNAQATMESPVKIDVTEPNLDKIVVNNKTTSETYEVENGYVLTEDGFYKIIAYDKAGNVSVTWNLTIDNNPPAITIENATANNYYNTDVVVNINDIELQQTYLNDVRQGRATTLTITEEGTYTVKAVDRFGHESNITFVIDKNAPNLAVDTIENGVSNTKDPQIHATDANSFKIVVKLNGEVVRTDVANQGSDGTYWTWFGIGYMPDGNYEVTSIDEAGNEKSYIFKLDRLNLIDSKTSSNYLDETANTIYNFNSFALKFNRDLTFNPLSTTQGYIIEMEYSTDGVNYTKSPYTVNNWNQTLVKDIPTNEKYGSSDYSTYTISANSPIHWSGTKVSSRWTDIYNAILATKNTDNVVYVRTLFTVVQPTYTKTFTLDEIEYSKGGSVVSKFGTALFE